jgi:hypothetical protein
VNTDHIAKAGNDGKILEALGVENEGGVVGVITGALLALKIERGIDDLEGADISVLVGLVGEGCIDDNTVDVLSLAGGEGSFVELNVLVLLFEIAVRTSFCDV